MKNSNNQTDGTFEVNINYLKGKKQNIYHDNDISNNNNKNLYV